MGNASKAVNQKLNATIDKISTQINFECILPSNETSFIAFTGFRNKYRTLYREDSLFLIVKDRFKV